MLSSLHINNIALIDKLDISFGAGFSALTGETGAGKSILIEAVGFILGERANRDSVRTGTAKASAEAEFEISQDGPAASFLKERDLYDGELLTVYRELAASGRGVCRINGTMVSASELKQLGELLCDLHGQHAHQSLLNPDTHIGLVDAFAGNLELRNELSSVRLAAMQKRRELNELRQGISDRARRLDMIGYQLNEIDSAELNEGEEEELLSVRDRMRNAEAIMEGLNLAHEALYGEEGALTKMTEAKEGLGSISGFDTEYEKQRAALETAYYTAEDVAIALRNYIADFSFEPDTLEQAEDRLELISRLKKKYGSDITSILEYRNKIALEREGLDNADERKELLEREEKRATDNFSRFAEKLSDTRKKAAERLKTEIERHLHDMGMPFASFSAEFKTVTASELAENGVDAMEFTFSANRGEPLKPLAKVASGGEISRVMLAFKTALAGADSIDTLIFDEIDTGISGLTALTVAKKMRELSKAHQVLSVTHLPQIAAHADYQYLIYKETRDDKTISSARLLDEDERPAELARIMGSTSDDAAAIEHARQLLKRSAE